MSLKFFTIIGVLLLLAPQHVFSQTATSPPVGEGFGFRIGGTNDPGASGIKPTLVTYYETHFGGLLLAGDLQFLFVGPQAIGIHLFTGAGDPVLESYGFHAILRGIFPSTSQWRTFVGGGFGFDVYSLSRNTVAAALPVIAGEIVPIGTNTDLELAARVTPLFFFDKNPGVSAGITVGIRFLN